MGTVMIEQPLIASIHNIKILLYGAIFLMLASLITMFVALIVHKAYVERREERFSQLKAAYVAVLRNNLRGNKIVIAKPKKKIEFEAIADALIELRAGANQNDVKKINKYASELWVVEFFRQMVGSRSWIKRYVAVETLGLLRLPETRGVFHHVIDNEKDADVTAKAVLGLSYIANKTDLSAISKVLSRQRFMSAKFSEHIYTNVIESFLERGKGAAFLTYLESARTNAYISLALKKAIVEACGTARFYASKDVIKSYLTFYDHLADMKIACLRAIGELGGDCDLNTLRVCFKDSDWRIRAVAAKSASSYSRTIVGDLRLLLRDENYHVRVNAAISMSKLGRKGIAALKRELKGDDGFARDASQYVLKGQGSHA